MGVRIERLPVGCSACQEKVEEDGFCYPEGVYVSFLIEVVMDGRKVYVCPTCLGWETPEMRGN